LRFGAFHNPPIIATAAGVKKHGVTTPDGEIVIDHRRSDGRQPKWAVPPVKGMRPPASCRIPKKLNISGDTFIPLSIIHKAPKGHTYLAIDTHARLRIIKSARVGVAEDEYGADGMERLRRERAILRELSDCDVNCPTVSGFRRIGSHAFLVLEDIPGRDLTDLEPRRAWAALVDLVEQVARLHAAGIVHRDVKLRNALRSGEQTYLIDFEHAARTGALVANSGGTRGHRSPTDGAVALPSVDVFALGACIAHSLLGLEPSALPLGAGRLVGLLACIGHRDAARLVADAMHRDPAARPTAAELSRRLHGLEHRDSVRTTASRHLGKAPDRAGSTLHKMAFRKAMEAVAHLAVFSRHSGGTCCWQTPHDVGGIVSETLESGAAGIILGLASIDRALGRKDFHGLIAGGAEWLTTRPGRGPAYGLFTGDAGIALVLSIIGTRLSRPDLVADARRRLAVCAENINGLDFRSGGAGVVWAASVMAGILRDQSLLGLGAPLVAVLSDHLREPPEASWRGKQASDHSDGDRDPASIALALAIWGRAANHPHVVAFAETLLIRFYRTAVRRARGADPFANTGDERFAGRVWRSGAMGYLWSLLQTFGDRPKFRAGIDRAVTSLLTSPPPASTSYKDGLAGQLEVWSMLTALPDYRTIALRQAQITVRLMHLLGIRNDGRWVWPSNDPEVISPTLWTGFVGSACALVRYCSGQHTPLLSTEWLGLVSRPCG
jgi:Protein kinase domain/Lanthionine synthetase C-like protein